MVFHGMIVPKEVRIQNEARRAEVFQKVNFVFAF